MLAVSGALLGDAVRIEVFLTDTRHFTAMNEVYEGFVSEPYPARTTVYVGLPEGPKVEIDEIAVVDKDSGRTRPCLSKGDLV